MVDLRVYCSLCENKIYLENVPDDDEDVEALHEYLDGLVKKRELTAWHEEEQISTDRRAESYTYVCIRCSPPIEFSDLEAVKQRLRTLRHDLTRAVVQIDEIARALNMDITLPKADD